jgi:transcriptional regulator with XRE-family HTH domain
VSYASEDLLAQLRRERERARITQRGLSQRSGVTQSHISQIESGKLEPGLSSFLALARSLDLEPVLVPRKLLPAVTGVLRAHGPFDPNPDPDTRKAIDRALRNIERARSKSGETEDLDRLTMSLITLRSAPLTPADTERLQMALRLINTSRKSPPPAVWSGASDLLWPIRNKFAHRDAARPRPAYALDENDRDA